MKINEQALNEATFNLIERTDDTRLIDFIDGISVILANDAHLILTNIYCLYRKVQNETLFDRLLESLDRDLKELLMLSVSRCPSEVVGDGHWPARYAVQATVAEMVSEGAAMAVSRLSGLVSVPLDEKLRINRLEVRISTLQEDSSIAESRQVVAHWFDGASATEFPSHRRQTLRGMLESCSDLWAARHFVYPNLVFLGACEEQIEGLESREFRQVRQRLTELEECAESWADGAATPSWRSLVTPENPGRHKFCTFINTDGIATLYEWHARFTPGPGRIHFRLLTSEKRLEIGYIGSKLGS